MRFLSVSVGCALVAAALSTGTAHAAASDECNSFSQTQNVADIRSNYSSVDRALVVQQTPIDGSTTWICVHAGTTSGNAGGKFVITGVGLSPVVDANVSVCATSNDVLAGQLGDPANPSTYVPYRFAASTAGNTVTICASVGATAVRVTYPVASGPPNLNFVPNSGTNTLAPAPRVTSIPAGANSDNCTGSLVSYNSPSNVVWYSLYGGTQGFVQLSSSNVCYRAITPTTTRGGRVTYTTGTYDIWLPADAVSTSNCTTTLSATTAPVQTSIRTGTSGAQTFLCASAAGTEAAVVARSDARAPSVTTPPGVTHAQD